MTDSELIETTRAKYRARPRTMSASAVAEATGLRKCWLDDFQWARTSKPNIKRVRLLDDYLTAQANELGQ